MPKLKVRRINLEESGWFGGCRVWKVWWGGRGRESGWWEGIAIKAICCIVPAIRRRQLSPTPYLLPLTGTLSCACARARATYRSFLVSFHFVPLSFFFFFFILLLSFFFFSSFFLLSSLIRILCFNDSANFSLTNHEIIVRN